MKNMYYILKDKQIIPVDDVITWAKWFEKANRHIANEKVGNKRVSTVFLGIDHGFMSEIPILFETMIFGDDEEYQERYATYEEAEEGHKRVVASIKAN